ncbi:T9SS type A sorting domain-containing protein [Dyadobacter bucti]|uniref:T9SS type A sorting domain-containing protein n=1 Tax=Dyadobacter bucti TaxID=2572203 RepID=UPI001107EC58|nr:T9SS type A sorting domain-containing protein [Dyadobacter bucti]
MKHTFITLLLLLGVAILHHSLAQLPEDPDDTTSIPEPEIPNVIQAQSAFPAVIPSSPNVSSLGKFMDIPVSYYTGTPSIAIPVYTVKNADTELPISIQYHGSGIRVEEEASQVGLGWALQAGGAIRRQIRGRDDLKSDGNAWRRLVELTANTAPALCINLSQGNYGIFTANSIGGGSTPEGAELAGILSDMTTISGFEPVVDAELDLFSYSIAGYSGQFVIEPLPGGLYTARSLTKDAVKITITGAQPAQWNFILTFPNGTEYTFDQREIQKVIDPGPKRTVKFQNVVEYGGPLYTSAAVEHVGAWYVTKIKSANRSAADAITFSYTTGPYVGQLPTGTETFYSTNNGPDSDPNFRWRVSEVLSQEVLLDEIVFTNGKVKFFRSSRSDRPAGSLKLDRIEVQTPGGTIVKTTAFTYDYFNSNSNAPDVVRKRLKLLSVQEKSGASTLPAYQLAYNSAVNLPDKNSYQQDYWGYFNGATVNDTRNTLLPSDQVVSGAQFKLPAALSTGADRNANAAFITANALTDITYPSGGKTTYTWEANTFTNASIQNTVTPVLNVHDFIGGVEMAGGGTRIKKIEHKESNGALKKQNQYEYQDPGTAQKTGKLMAALTFMEWVDGGVLYSSASRHPMGSSAQGHPVGYNVVITFDGATRLANGYSAYQYENKVELTNSTTFCMAWGQGGGQPACAVQPVLYSVGSFNCSPYSGPIMNNKSVTEASMPNIVHYLNGSLLNETHYNGQNKPVRAIINTYESTVDKLFPHFKVKATDGFTFGLSYKTESAWNRLKDSREITYDQDGDLNHFTQTVSEYTYSSTYLQPVKIVTTDSKTGPAKVPVTINAEQVMVYDRQLETLFKYPFDFADPVSVAMTGKNMISVPVETATQLAIVSGNVQTFTPVKWHKTIYALYPPQLYLPQTAESKLGTAQAASTDIAFLSYDQRGNLLTYKDRGGNITQLEYFTTGDIGSTDLLKKKTESDGNAPAQSIGYTHKPLVGVETVTDPNGKVLFYEYEEFNRLINIRDNSAGGALRASFCYNQAGQNIACGPLAPISGVINPASLILLADSSEVPLPVKLIRFTARKETETAFLQWETAEELNSDQFEIERSTTGKQWERIGSIPAQTNGPAGSIVEKNANRNYSFTDAFPVRGQNLYRLKMTDLDSTFAYSKIEALSFDKPNDIMLYPNPITMGEQLNLRLEEGSIDQVQIYDIYGKLVHDTSNIHPGQQGEIRTSHLAVGVYVIKVTRAGGVITTHRVVKQ